MTIRTYGFLASVIGSALGAWWWMRHRAAQAAGLTPARAKGTVIYDNTPTPPASAEGVI